MLLTLRDASISIKPEIQRNIRNSALYIPILCGRDVWQPYCSTKFHTVKCAFTMKDWALTMASEEPRAASPDHLQKRWLNIRKVLERSGPFCHPDFEPSADILEFLMSTCKVLVIGAGGLGCELLKSLALMGFRQIHVVDMDIIELSNLNRQFLFRRKDIGSSKAEVAAAFINARIPGCNVVPHHCPIQELDASFYRQFHLVACGLDSIIARRWLNGMLISLLNYNDDGSVDQSTVVPLIDGGTEGFKGNARVILPGMSACIECTLDLYPPQITYPLCTIANTPRLPEHCIEYVKVLQWPKDNPWGAVIDGDDPLHVNWIYEKAQDRARQFHIQGLTYRLTQGVVKNIIPAVASTNAIIAATCTTELFKIATSCCVNLNNYMVFNDVDGIYTYTYEAERKADCIACSMVPKVVTLEDPKITKLKDLLLLLQEGGEYQMKSPGLTTVINGKNRTLYMSTVASIEERTRDNLNKSMYELGILADAEILVADVTNPNTVTLKVKYQSTDTAMEMA